MVSALAAASGSQVSLTFLDARESETVLPFQEIHQRASRVAQALGELGIAAGDRVALALPTAPSFVEALFGVLLAGAVAVPLYPPLRLGRLEEYHQRTARMLLRVGARLVLTDARIRRLLGEPMALARPELGCRLVEDLRTSSAASGRVDSRAGPDDLAIIQFSSGSTVEPKPVALTHANILANLAAIDRVIPADDGGRTQSGVSWLPLYHDMGLIGCLLEAAYRPGPLTLIPPELFLARPAMWLRAISRARATVSPAPNFAFGLCLKRISDEELTGVDLSSWQLALTGAEPVSPEVLRRFADRFARWGFNREALRPVYGLAEASLAVTFCPRRSPSAMSVDPVELARSGEVAEGAREIPSVGSPLAGVEVEVRDLHGREVPERRVGRIFVKGPSVMAGYFDDPQATRQVLREGGWLDTGDLGFHAGGELYVCGREKDVVILRGANHSPQEFEECLAGLAGLREGCAVALGYQPTGEDGEELALLVECAAGAEPTSDLVEAIRGEVLARTGIRPYLVELLKPGTLPRTSSGKLRRAEARRQLLAGKLGPPKPVTTMRLVRAVLRSSLAFARVLLSDPSRPRPWDEIPTRLREP
ncbi:MAG: fatty acyl-AMP ligase [Deltaproteobacteria bacterium]|nr:fatty acyl-AMP ligase [Deltaproteobacteria bacterium]